MGAIKANSIAATPCEFFLNRVKNADADFNRGFL